jgi:hypothetical protein
VSYEYQLDNGTWQSVAGTSTGDLTVAAGSHTITARAVNSGGKTGAPDAATTSITAQGTPGAVSVSGGVSGQTVSWSWSGGSASPGGLANVQYRYNVNSGGWSGWSSTTSASRSGPGTYSIQVQARNKAGESAIASNGPHTIVQPQSVTLCFRNADGVRYFSVKFSGMSGGSHWFRVTASGGSAWSSIGQESGTSGQSDLGSWIDYDGPGDDNDGAIVAIPQYSNSGNGGPWTNGTSSRVENIPWC